VEELSRIVGWRKREWEWLLGELVDALELEYVSSRPVRKKVTVREDWCKQLQGSNFIPVLCPQLPARDL
jgi:hypothetical protein